MNTREIRAYSGVHLTRLSAAPVPLTLHDTSQQLPLTRFFRYSARRFEVLGGFAAELNGKQVKCLRCPRNGQQVWTRQSATVRKHGKAMRFVL